MSRWMGWVCLAIGIGAAGCARAGRCEDCAPVMTDGGIARQAVSCEAMCAARDGACGVSRTDCMSRCTTADALATQMGCGAEGGAARACLAEYREACGGDLTLLCAPEDQAAVDCFHDACASNPSDPACAQICVAACEGIELCGSDRASCETPCINGAASVPDGCGAEYWAMVECIDDRAVPTCDPNACAAESTAFRACVDGGSPLPISLPPYSACSAGDTCEGGTCATIETSTTSGSMCTVACDTSADCPELDVLCVTLSGSFGGQCARRCDGDLDCEDGTYCLWESSAYEYVCLPDV